MPREPLQVDLLTTAYRPDQLRLITGPAVLFIGRSNAGKSSLLNAITRKELAKISKTPGKTRSINYFQYGPKITLVDLPGYGYARRGKDERGEWAKLMKVFFDSLETKALGYILMDSRRKLEDEEWSLVKNLLGQFHQVRVLLTKADQLKQSERVQAKRYLDAEFQNLGMEGLLTWRFVSIKKIEGVEEIRREIYQYGQNFSL